MNSSGLSAGWKLSKPADVWGICRKDSYEKFDSSTRQIPDELG